MVVGKAVKSQLSVGSRGYGEKYGKFIEVHTGMDVSFTVFLRRWG
jgi:hypothetical protein